MDADFASSPVTDLATPVSGGKPGTAFVATAPA
jgi:hypothetical protein